MRSPTLLATLALTLSPCVSSLALAGDEEPDDGVDLWYRQQSLTSLSDQLAAEFTEKMAGDAKKLERAYPGAPPQVPHDIADMLPLTRTDNECLDCHHPDNALSKRDAPIPESHFMRPTVSDTGTDEALANKVMGYTKSSEVLQARYNCVMCHVPQATNVKSLESNFVNLTTMPAPSPSRVAPEAPKAAPPPASAAAAPAKGKPKTTFKFNGLYTLWGLSQNNFLLGKQIPKDASDPTGAKVDHPLDDAAYTVQMLRLQGKAQRGKIGAVARMDVGQGWWGANNSPNVSESSSLDADGNVVNSSDYNANKLFTDKDTNYAIHVDLAYGWAEFDLGGIPLTMSAGRQYYGVGHKLVLDEDYDGVQAKLVPFHQETKVGDKIQTKEVSIQAAWAKVCEGRGCFTTPKGLLMSDGSHGLTGSSPDAYGDADLLYVKGKMDWPDHHGEAFGIYYGDNSNQTDWAFLPNGLGYARSRYTPQITQAMVIGLSGDGRFDVGDGLVWKAEADILSGKDTINNTDYGGGTVDINDGSLSGTNLYLDLTQHVGLTEKIKGRLGGLFGYGSGDSDKTGGKGNFNKIQTMGFFPLTNVWEDSVMPDVEGISPQGLGSPVSRGYREFENTIAVQGKLGIKPSKPLDIQVSYTYLQASQPIQGFDATGVPVGKGATDLGTEFDANLVIKFSNGLMYKGLFGYFVPGAAAGNLMNGTADFSDPAWELKNVLLVKF